MNSYYDRRQILSDALCPYLTECIQAAGFPEFEIGGSLLTPDGTPVMALDSLGSMAQVMSAHVTRADGERRYLAMVFQPLEREHVAVSILTDLHAPRHVVHIAENDVRPSIPHLKSLLEETVRDLARA